MTKLNLGCGDDRRPGYVNVDVRPGVGDLAADVRDLPVPSASVEILVAHDILEHLPPQDTLRALREWHRVLVPGGTLDVKVPNMKMLCEWIVDDFRTELAIRNIYGGHRWGPDGAWDCHHAGWTPSTFRDLLTLAEFDIVSNDEKLNMTVVAKSV